MLPTRCITVNPRIQISHPQGFQCLVFFKSSLSSTRPKTNAQKNHQLYMQQHKTTLKIKTGTNSVIHPVVSYPIITTTKVVTGYFQGCTR